VAKVIAGNDGCRDLDIGGRVIRREKGGFAVPDRDAKAIATAIGGAVCGTSLAASRAPAYWCEPCEFRTPFTRCGRCGGPTKRED
jgi:hypothetical protein